MQAKFPPLFGAMLCAGSSLAAAQDEPARPAAALPSVVVTATRTEALAEDVPASISRIDGSEVRAGHALVNISESLGVVPGLVARDRQNYAQDVQISVRGFGARSTFGIRGVRLYVDGIPATLPDGQGQISNVELSAIDRIEVLRGPFSALYGNSSGGVIQVFTPEGEGPATVGFSAAGGSDKMFRLGAQTQGASANGFAWNLAWSRFHTDGYRDHSAAERFLGNAKLNFHLDADTTVTLVANSVGLPEAQDPLGLSRAVFEANPRGVDSSAITYNTRKSVNQTQVGVIFDRRVDASDALRVLVYGGERGTRQFQAIPANTEGSPLNPGGVISLGRNYEGVDLRWTHQSRLAGQALTIVGGLSYDVLSEQREGYQNFIGTSLGVQGALRRNETNEVTSLDPYVQANWRFAPQWSLDLGVRRSRVSFVSTDHYVTASNPDDSGSAAYQATLPVAGLMFAANDALHLYVSAGRGFETPTLNELAYRSGGQTGLNFALQAATSTSVEAGLKARLGAWGELSAAAFRTETAHEIVTQTNVAGRATYQNAGATRRTGAELAWSGRYFEHLRAQVAASLLNATYQDAFLTCTTTRCPVANIPVAAGSRIPGIARGNLFATLGWTPPSGWRGAVEARYSSSVVVNDLNIDAAPRYATAAAYVGYAATFGRWELSSFVRSDNLFDRHYAGSVIVNEGNARYFEPAPGRSWLVSTAASLRF